MTGPRPLRIFHIFRAPVGGLFRHVTDLATEQTRDGHDVGIICDSSTGGAYEDDILKGLRKRLALGITRIAMPRLPSPADFTATRTALATLRPIAPDVIHGHGAKGGVYARVIAARLGARTPLACLYTPHGGSMHYDPRSLQGRIYFAAERFLERYTDALIHVSEFEAETYRIKLGPPRCLARVIPNGLRPEEFDPVTPRADAKDILFLGSFRAIKGIETFLQALSKLRAAGSPVTAQLIGPPEGRADYVAQANALGLGAAVAFGDPMPARSAFVTAHSIAVPSFAESMPYVVLEAIAAGVPIVATRVGGIPEIFGPRADELVPAGDATALAAAIKGLLDDPAFAQRDALARREWLRPRFNVAAMTQGVVALYREILQRKRGMAG